MTKPATKPASAKKPTAAKAASAKSAAKAAAKSVPKVAAKPLISKPKKNAQAAKKTPKGGKPAAPIQKALKAQKKVSIIVLLKALFRTEYNFHDETY